MIPYSIRLLFASVLLSGMVGARLLRAESLPEPPVPPAEVPAAAAPVPNKEATPPPPPVAADQSLRLTPENFRTQSKRDDPAAGYVPSSQYENSTEQKGLQTLGLLVRVPLKPER
jgi:hypothetical protein